MSAYGGCPGSAKPKKSISPFHWSWGGIFLLTFLILIVLFIGIGMGVNICIQKKRGMEIIPLLSMWICIFESVWVWFKILYIL
jgi:hypothetical protein